MAITQAAKLFVRSLFEQAEEILQNDFYRRLKDEDTFFTKAVGVSFDQRQEYITELQDGDKIVVRRDINNIYDRNAIEILDTKNRLLGYLNKKMAAYFAPLVDKGIEYNCNVSAVTGRDRDTLGLNLYFERKDYVEDQLIQEGLKERSRLQGLKTPELLEEIRSFLLGKYPYRPKQRESLDKLFARKNTLSVMGTGRGKSAIFQSYATFQAIRNEKITIIVYPLRALVNDQYEALKRKLTPVGMKVYKANGSLTEWERERFQKALRNGEVDMILTTPEFLEYHLEKFKAIKNRIGFFVADESHHIGLDSVAFRPSYQKLDWILKELGNPLTLAVTATANDEVANQIVKTLNIKEVVIDPHVRANLKIFDFRNVYISPRKNKEIPEDQLKESYIARLIQSGRKTLIYVNSREKTVTIAEKLRELVPELEDQIVFYNAGLTSKERNTVEDLFRKGEVRVVVSTSAFGEGIDNPDIRYVVHYHVNFNFVDFNQQSGRGGRDGNRAEIHLLFGWEDIRLNKFILEASTPDRDYLALVYKFLAKQRKCELTNGEISEQLEELSAVKLTTSADRVSAAIGILEELGLISVERDGRDRSIMVLPATKRLDLNSSARYAEAMKEKEVFEKFSMAIMNERGQDLLGRINKPIYPTKFMPKQRAVS